MPGMAREDRSSRTRSSSRRSSINAFIRSDCGAQRQRPPKATEIVRCEPSWRPALSRSTAPSLSACFLKLERNEVAALVREQVASRRSVAIVYFRSAIRRVASETAMAGLAFAAEDELVDVAATLGYDRARRCARGDALGACDAAFAGTVASVLATLGAGRREPPGRRSPAAGSRP